MPAQRRTTTPTAQRPPPARPQAVAPRSTSNADRQAQVGTADPVVEAPTQDPKTLAIEAYATRLWEVVGELMLLEDTKLQAARARAVMGQAADVDFALRMGERVEVDLLPRYPEGDQGRMPVGALPPRWVQPARILLQMGGGSGASPTFQPEGGSTDLWQAGQAEVSTPWGASRVSIAPGAQLMVELIDGRRTWRSILGALRAAGATVSESDVMRTMAALRRMRVITLSTG